MLISKLIDYYRLAAYIADKYIDPRDDVMWAKTDHWNYYKLARAGQWRAHTITQMVLCRMWYARKKLFASYVAFYSKEHMWSTQRGQRSRGNNAIVC